MTKAERDLLRAVAEAVMYLCDTVGTVTSEDENAEHASTLEEAIEAFDEEAEE